MRSLYPGLARTHAFRATFDSTPQAANFVKSMNACMYYYESTYSYSLVGIQSHSIKVSKEVACTNFPYSSFFYFNAGLFNPLKSLNLLVKLAPFDG